MILRNLLLLAGVLVLFSGKCVDTQPIKDAVEIAADVIDKGIEDLQSESSNWQQILVRVSEQLPKDVSEIIRVDAANLAKNAISATGVELRCNVDFLRNRAKDALTNLKNKLLGKPYKKLPPNFCQVVPAFVDLNIDPVKWSNIAIYGYDLYAKDESDKMVQVGILADNGTVSYLPENRIGRTSNYELTLNLAGMANRFFNEKIVKLQLQYDNNKSGYPEIVVNEWRAQTRQVANVEVNQMSFTPQQNCGGDGDFDTGSGEPMTVTLKSELQVQENDILGRVYMHAREDHPDNTCVQGWSEWRTLYNAPAGWKITAVTPRTQSPYNTKITEHGEKRFSLPAGESVTYYYVKGDRDGDEKGTYTSVRVVWGKLNVSLVQKAPNF
ncbi:MAG: hypothetical protein WCF67_21935 [Chitinophagaceae bacterium]